MVVSARKIRRREDGAAAAPQEDEDGMDGMDEDAFYEIPTIEIDPLVVELHGAIEDGRIQDAITVVPMRLPLVRDTRGTIAERSSSATRAAHSALTETRHRCWED